MRKTTTVLSLKDMFRQERPSLSADAMLNLNLFVFTYNCTLTDRNETSLDVIRRAIFYESFRIRVNFSKDLKRHLTAFAFRRCWETIRSSLVHDKSDLERGRALMT